MRAAPFDVAPELTRVHAGDRLSVDDQPSGAWRRVRLPSGRFGFVNEADVAIVAAPPASGPAGLVAGAAAPTSGSAVPVPGRQSNPDATPNATPPATPPTTPAAPPPTLLGVVLQLMPVGTLVGTASMNTTVSADTVFATAVAPFIDVVLSPYAALGFSPQVIFRVKPDGSTSQSATEFDLRARLTGRVPVSGSSYLYGRLSPGFSIISIPSSATKVASDPIGFVVDVAVGAEFSLLPRLFLVVDLGYQIGFQSGSVGDDISQVDADYHSRYLHVGSGLALRL